MTNPEIEINQETLGAFLSRTRRELNLDLNKIAEDTKISIKNLEAIENSNFTSLPAEVFSRGF